MDLARVNCAANEGAGRRLDPVREEIANTITHGIGLALSVAGIIALIDAAASAGGIVLVSCVIYGSTLVALYAASTVYHGATCPRKKRVLRVADHICIYLLIAGTYTPFSIIKLQGPWGWTMFGVVWGLAIVGSVTKVYLIHRADLFAAGLYLGMGWIGALAIKPIIMSIPPAGLALVVIGGLLYTGGVYFFLRDARRRYFHAVWHVFVMGGSACHYFAVLYYVVP